MHHPDGAVKHPGLDNYGMGTAFEEPVHRFNEEKGEHWSAERSLGDGEAGLPAHRRPDQLRHLFLLYDSACGTAPR